MGNNDIVAIIPARSGSKGLIDKNITLLNGKPLIAYSIRVAQLSKYINRVVVSTDSQEYAEIASKYNAEIPFLRPKKLSRDTSTDFDLLRNILEWFQLEINTDLIIYLRPTTPLRDPKVIECAIEKMMVNKNYTALRSVHEMSESSYKTFEITKNCLKPIGDKTIDMDFANRPRQLFPKTYQGNGYVDIIRPEIILKNNLMYGNKVFAFKTEVVHEVDNLNDFLYIQYQVKQKMKVYKNLFGANNEMQ